MRKRQILVLLMWVNTIFLVSLIPNIMSQEMTDTEFINEKVRVEWYHTFGGSNDEFTYSLIQASDGGFGIVGSTESYGGGESDLYLVKTDSKGNFQWDYIFGGPDYERAEDVIMTPDGGFVVLGAFSSISQGYGEFSNFLIKIDKAGVKRWNVSFQESDITDATDFVQTSDGGFAIAGASSSDISLLKTDAVGIKQWNQTYRSPNREFNNTTFGVRTGIRTKIVQVSDGGFIITGDPIIYTAGPSISDQFILKTDNNGAMQWNKTFGLNVRVDDLTPTSDGGFVIFVDQTLMKFDLNGISQWNHSSEQFPPSSYLIQTNDGGFAITGGLRVNQNGDRDIYVVRTYANGTIQWNQTSGVDRDDRPSAIIQSDDDGFVVAGISKFSSSNLEISDINLIKFSERSPDSGISNQKLIASLFGLTAFLGLGLYLLKFRSPKGFSELRINKTIKETLSRIFNGRTKGYLLLASGVQKTSEEDSLGTHIPKSLFQYKFLMHPVRLSMMKILTENQVVTSIELKNKLDLSWGEFSHHLPNMKKNHLIQIDDKFIDGITKQVITVTLKGSKEYANLVKILHEFFSSSDYDTFPFNYKSNPEEE